MQASRTIGRLVIKRFGERNASHHAAQTTYNDLPQPQGSWKTHFDANQRKYNAHLALGIGTLVGTIVFGKVMGFLEFYDDIPEKPASISSYSTK